MQAIALVDRDPMVLDMLRSALSTEDASIEFMPPGEVAGDLVIWNLSDYPHPTESLIGRLRRSNPRVSVILTWRDDEPLEGLITALRLGIDNAMSIKDGLEPLIAELRRVLQQRLDNQDERLMQELVDRNFTLSIVNEVLRGINESRSHADLQARAITPLAEAVGATSAQLTTRTLGDEPDNLSVSPRFEIRAGEYMACFPVVAQERRWGTLWLTGPSHLLEQLHGLAPVVQALCGQLGLALASIQVLESSRRQATVNEQTGFAHPEHFRATLRALHERARRYKEIFALVLIEPTLGFEGRPGEAAIRASAALIRQAIRPGDLAAEDGEGRLALLLPGTTEEAASTLAERLGRAIARSELAAGGGLSPMGAIFGAAAWSEHLDAVPETLHARAAEALSRARACGRNGIRAAGSI